MRLNLRELLSDNGETVALQKFAQIRDLLEDDSNDSLFSQLQVLEDIKGIMFDLEEP